MFEELRYTSMLYQYKIQQMTTTNEAIVELWQRLTKKNQEQGNQIEKLISQIEALTKILSSNGSRVSQQEEENKENTNKRCNLCGQFHRNPNFLGVREKFPIKANGEGEKAEEIG